jgi:cytochrome c553
VVGQLGKWREGLRRAVAPDCMAAIAKRLTREDVTAISTWLASQPIPPGAKPAPAAELAPPLPCGSLSK